MDRSADAKTAADRSTRTRGMRRLCSSVGTAAMVTVGSEGEDVEEDVEKADDLAA